MPYKLRKVRNKDLYFVISTETGHKHSNEPLSKEMAKKQLRAINANYSQVRKSRGEGFHVVPLNVGIESDYNEEKAGGFNPPYPLETSRGSGSQAREEKAGGFNPPYPLETSRGSGSQAREEKAGDFDSDLEGAGVVDFLKSIPGRITGFISGKRYDYQPNDRKLLEEIGNQIVDGICIYRVPLDKNLNKAVNAITLGKFQDFKKNNNYDDMFHLYAVAKLANGEYVKFEKNEVINLDKVNYSTLPQEQQYKLDININNGDPKVSFQQMLNNTLKAMGPDNYWQYDPLKNNCQNYIYNVMIANNWVNSNPRLKDFVLQSLNQLNQELSDAQKGIMSGITKLGARFNILRKGKGFGDVINLDDVE